MTGLQILELVFSLMQGIGGVGSVIVEIKKGKLENEKEKKSKES